MESVIFSCILIAMNIYWKVKDEGLNVRGVCGFVCVCV